MKNKIIRAQYDNDTITVYQAYNDLIANTAVDNQNFISPPFKKERMTWIKPSFFWMMYRSGWGEKQSQDNILAIRIKREGFEWALRNSCVSKYLPELYDSHEIWKNTLKASSVRIQWDPERDHNLEILPYRSIQIGLTGAAVNKYLSDWIVEIQNITPQCKEIKNLIDTNQIVKAKELIPFERIYPLPNDIAKKINSDQ